MTDDAASVLAELARSASLRRLDLMQRTGMSRTRVAAALDALCAAGLVTAFSMGSRYSVRKPSICPPATPAHTSGLADDTQRSGAVPCGADLSAVAHT